MALELTTSQVLIVLGWCEEAEIKSQQLATPFERARQWAECALEIKLLSQYREIKDIVMAELSSRGAHPIPGERPS